MGAELLDWLLRSALGLGVAIALVLALRPVWRRALGAGSVLWLWLLLPAALVATSLPARVQVQELPAEAWAELPAGTTAGHAGAGPSGESTANPVAPGTFDATTPMLVAWLIGALLLGGALAVQQRRFRRRLGRLTPRGDGSFRAAHAGAGPVVIGVLRPRIVVPADFEARYDARQRELVLAHERCHLRRGDLHMNLLACALRCVFWFNPLVHLAASRLRLDQELACDAAVLREFPRAGRAYAAALLNTQLADLGLPVGCAWQSSHPLVWRIDMLKRPSPGLLRRAVGIGLAVLATTATAATVWQQQPVRTLAMPAIPLPERTGLPGIDVDVALEAVVAPSTLATIAAATPERPPMRPAPAPRFLPEPTRATLPPPPEPKAAPEPLPAPVATAVAQPQADDYRSPRVVRFKPARMPILERNKAAMAGAVLVARVDLDERGEPVRVSVYESELNDVYERNALAAVRRWDFEPAREGGKPVPASILVPVRFAPEHAIDQDGPLRHPPMHYPPPPPQQVAGQ